MPVVDGRRGRAFDLRDRDVTVEDVVAAIREKDPPAVRGDGASLGRERDRPLTVRCPSPGAVHERVGVVRPDREYALRAALAAAARALGHESSVAAELQTVRERLAELDPPAVSLDDEQRAVAETETADDLEERVAALRGQLDAARERGDDPAALEDATEDAIADLAARRTERLAAEQSLERARERARERRDRREERLRLQDRERNLERDARRELAGTLRDSFERALASVPGPAGASAVGDAAPAETAPGDTEADHTVPGDTAIDDVDLGDRPWQVDDRVAGALAVCRVAPLSAPVVLAVDRFSSARAAAAALDAPVVLVERS